MAEKYMNFPGDLKALMMEEQAGLGKQGTLNLRTLTAGSTQYEDVVKALKVMDLDEEGLTSGKGKSSFMAGAASYEVDAEDAFDELEDKSLASEDVQDILAEIEGLNLVEDEAMDVLASLEKEKRSWRENKKLKLARRKDRRHFSGKPTGHYDRGGHGISTEQLKRVSRCSNCGDRGHWVEDCDKPYRSKKDRLAQEASAKKGKDRAVAEESDQPPLSFWEDLAQTMRRKEQRLWLRPSVEWPSLTMWTRFWRSTPWPSNVCVWHSRSLFDTLAVETASSSVFRPSTVKRLARLYFALDCETAWSSVFRSPLSRANYIHHHDAI